MQKRVISSYLKNGEQFFDEFRGSFSGLLYDKNNKTWLIYTGHIGDKQIFYRQTDNSIIFGSEMQFLVDCSKTNDLQLSLNEEAAYMLLTYGFYLENHTITKEIKKLVCRSLYKST